MTERRPTLRILFWLRTHPAGGQGAYPHEIWRYRYISNVGKNIEMELVDKTDTGDYRLTLGPSEKRIELNQLNTPDPTPAPPTSQM